MAIPEEKIKSAVGVTPALNSDKKRFLTENLDYARKQMDSVGGILDNGRFNRLGVDRATRDKHIETRRNGDRIRRALARKERHARWRGDDATSLNTLLDARGMGLQIGGLRKHGDMDTWAANQMRGYADKDLTKAETAMNRYGGANGIAAFNGGQEAQATAGGAGAQGAYGQARMAVGAPQLPSQRPLSILEQAHANQRRNAQEVSETAFMGDVSAERATYDKETAAMDFEGSRLKIPTIGDAMKRDQLNENTGARDVFEYIDEQYGDGSISANRDKREAKLSGDLANIDQEKDRRHEARFEQEKLDGTYEREQREDHRLANIERVAAGYEALPYTGYGSEPESSSKATPPPQIPEATTVPTGETNRAAMREAALKIPRDPILDLDPKSPEFRVAKKRRGHEVHKKSRYADNLVEGLEVSGKYIYDQLDKAEKGLKGAVKARRDAAAVGKQTKQASDLVAKMTNDFRFGTLKERKAAERYFKKHNAPLPKVSSPKIPTKKQAKVKTKKESKSKLQLQGTEKAKLNTRARPKLK